MKRRWRSSGFLAETTGVAALEFAFIAPVLAIITILMSDVSMAAVGAMNMESAVRASIQYAMNGGTDMTAAKNVGVQSWANPPADATMTASEACLCGAASGICGQVCADGSIPQTYVTATATGTLGGSVISFNKTTTQTVRVN